jgi:hypothetical protein
MGAVRQQIRNGASLGRAAFVSGTLSPHENETAVWNAVRVIRLPSIQVSTESVLMAETAIQFLERWREDFVYAEPRAIEQLDATVAECMADAAEAGISADDLEKAAGSSLKQYLCTAIIDTSE